MSFFMSLFFGTWGMASYVVLPFLPAMLLGSVVAVLGFLIGRHLTVVGVVAVGASTSLLSVLLSYVCKDKLIIDWSDHGGFFPGPSSKFDGGDIWKLGIVCVVGIALGYGGVKLWYMLSLSGWRQVSCYAQCGT